MGLGFPDELPPSLCCEAVCRSAIALLSATLGSSLLERAVVTWSAAGGLGNGDCAEFVVEHCCQAWQNPCLELFRELFEEAVDENQRQLQPEANSLQHANDLFEQQYPREDDHRVL